LHKFVCSQTSHHVNMTSQSPAVSVWCNCCYDILNNVVMTWNFPAWRPRLGCGRRLLTADFSKATSDVPTHLFVVVTEERYILPFRIHVTLSSQSLNYVL